MKSSFTYPVVYHADIINLFHAILFWRYEEKSASRFHHRFWFISFNTVWSLLAMGRVLSEARIERLRGKKELCTLFLKQTLVVEQWDRREWDAILQDGVFKNFAIRKGNRELVSGNAVNFLELCSRTKVFITPFGVRTASDAVEAVSHLLRRDDFLQLWERYTVPFKEKDPRLLGSIVKERNAELDEEIWGDKHGGESGEML